MLLARRYLPCNLMSCCKCRNSQTHTLQATRFGSSHTSSMLHAAMHALCCCRMATAPGLSIGQQTACCEPAGWGATGMAIKCQLGSVISAPLLTHINSAPVTPKGNDRATSAAFVPLSVNPPLREVLPWEYPAACLLAELEPGKVSIPHLACKSRCWHQHLRQKRGLAFQVLDLEAHHCDSSKCLLSHQGSVLSSRAEVESPSSMRRCA